MSERMNEWMNEWKNECFSLNDGIDGSPENSCVEMTAELNLSDETQPSSNNSSFRQVASIHIYYTTDTKYKDQQILFTLFQVTLN